MLRTAAQAAEWMRDASNKDQLTSFCEKLGTQLRQCLKCNHKKFDRDTIRRLYHQVRTSDGFVKDWSQLFNDSAGNLYPFLYEHVTDIMFTELIKFEVSQISDDTVEDVTPKLTVMEQNALRYICRYVCRKISESIDSTAGEEKADLTYALMELEL